MIYIQKVYGHAITVTDIWLQWYTSSSAKETNNFMAGHTIIVSTKAFKNGNCTINDIESSIQNKNKTKKKIIGVRW